MKQASLSQIPTKFRYRSHCTLWRIHRSSYSRTLLETRCWRATQNRIWWEAPARSTKFRLRRWRHTTGRACYLWLLLLRCHPLGACRSNTWVIQRSGGRLHPNSSACNWQGGREGKEDERRGPEVGERQGQGWGRFWQGGIRRGARGMIKGLLWQNIDFLGKAWNPRQFHWMFASSKNQVRAVYQRSHDRCQRCYKWFRPIQKTSFA